LRSFTRAGSAISIAGLKLRVGGAHTRVSCFDFVHVASSVSVRAFLALGGCARGLSSLDQTAISSSLSVRSFIRSGSSLSVAAKRGYANRVGGVVSAAQFVTLASSLSLRAMRPVASRGFIGKLSVLDGMQ
jgi:hypothetical protein